MAMHLCGKIKPDLKLIRERGVDLVEAVSPIIVGGDVELPEVRKAWGERVVVNGGAPAGLDRGLRLWRSWKLPFRTVQVMS